ATFSHLLSHFTQSGVGRAAASNTLGATLAPFVFGLWLIPSAGYGIAFYVAIAIYGTLFIGFVLWKRRELLWAAAGGFLAAAVGLQAYSPLILIRFSPNVQVLGQQVGIQGVVTVTETAGP